ncbi:ParA family protein [Salinarimonas chemoclinalis]|uniref:ParA family protein n=1 Tax=Salinarimonas chemoclinalis TaxID=3241599 RepID=UPI003555BF71
MRYAVWNNKGGVGKSFVTFITACEYARQHPERKVVIVDMCPQANVSEVVLGGNGKGATELEALLGKTPRQTVGGYFDERISSPHKITGNETNFLLKAASFNDNLDDNIFLVAGDPSLEIQAEAINQIAGQTLPSSSWANVHQWLKDLLLAIGRAHPNAVFFIDCNPSFSAYTELAIIAAERLIVPCSADGSSARAISNIGQLIYGINVPQAYATVSFSQRAKNNGLAVPTVHVIPLNRSTQYEQKPSKAFSAMYDEIIRRAKDLMAQNSTIFSAQADTLFLDIPDAHSVSVVTSHLGLPLHKIKLGKYNIHEKDTQVPKDSLARYKTAFASLVGRL